MYQRPLGFGSLALALVGLGALCRLAQYAAGRSIWHDEAYVALNVLSRSYSGLLGPLEWHEPSPPGFLLLEKFVVSILGRSEYAWRLVPLLAGLASLPLFAALARAVAGERVALTALALYATSTKLVAQASEVKHFTLDCLSALAIAWVALAIRRSARPRALFLVLALVGTVSPWLSYASVFSIGAAGLVLAVDCWTRWGTRERAAFVGASGAIALSLVFLWTPLHAQIDDTVVGFWGGAFPDTSSPIALLGWLVRAHVGLAGYFWPPFGVVLFGLAMFGLRGWPSERRAELALLLVPVALGLAASFLRRWPYGGNQHVSFAAAAVLVLAARGALMLPSRVPPAWQPALSIAALAVLFPGFAGALWHIAAPRERHEVRPVLDFVRAHRTSEAQLLVFCPAEAELYLGESFRGSQPSPDPARPVWFIGTRSVNRPFPNQALLDSLAARRARLQSIEEHGAAAYLFAPEFSVP